MSYELPAPATATLLIIDDDILQVNIIKKIAMQLGYGITVAQSAAVAIDLICTRAFSHITVDLSLGDGDGIELLRSIAACSPVPNVIVISGCDERILSGVLRMAVSSGLSDAKAIPKPIKFALLREALQGFEPATSAAKSEAGLRSPVTEVQLYRAIYGREIYPAFQPKIRLSTGTVAGCEALARWQSRELGRVAPDRFVSLAERCDLIKPLTLLMLDSAVRDMRSTIVRDPEFVVAVNLSAALLSDLSIPEEVERILSAYHVPPSSLMLEVTESTAMSDLSRATDVLLRLRIKGINLSIDDFGTGYSSLSALARMPFNELKIDQSFVKSCRSDQDMWKIVRGSIALAREFGMKVVAEGIEDQDTWHALDAIGCDIGQGFLFSPALPKAEFEAWCRNWESTRLSLPAPGAAGFAATWQARGNA
jgi:EAL domain-containing protein (putative c-di-GMP-specific phosphodiesterase class I)/CheY-like chemotaxis protein